MSDIIRITPGWFVAGSGKFDSRRRYLRQALTGTGSPMVKGDSANASGTYVYRYSVNGFVRQATAAYAGNQGSLPLDATPFDGVAVIVKKQ